MVMEWSGVGGMRMWWQDSKNSGRRLRDSLTPGLVVGQDGWGSGRLWTSVRGMSARSNTELLGCCACGVTGVMMADGGRPNKPDENLMYVAKERKTQQRRRRSSALRLATPRPPRAVYAHMWHHVWMGLVQFGRVMRASHVWMGLVQFGRVLRASLPLGVTMVVLLVLVPPTGHRQSGAPPTPLQSSSHTRRCRQR
jgi:hypothetical protein